MAETARVAIETVVFLDSNDLSFRKTFQLSLCFIFSLPFFATANTYTGTVTFDKDTITATGNFITKEPVNRARITLTGDSGDVIGLTDDSGNFSIFSSDNTVEVYAETTGFGVTVGTSYSVSSSGMVGIHKVKVGDLFSTSTALGKSNITDTTAAPAFNIYNQLVKGKNFIKDDLSPSLVTSVEINCEYPGSAGTQYNPTNNYMIIQNTSTDPDGYDDHIILHEFGHWVAENFSVDSSQGGVHTVTSATDIRLSWSEGLAHYISSAIRGEAFHYDYSTAGVGTFDISAPGTAKGSDIELVIANFLWQVQQNHGINNVFSTLTSFNSLPTSISSDPISLDTFYDMWMNSSSTNTLSLSTFVTDLGLSYYTDTLNTNSTATSTSPEKITAPDSYAATDMSFFTDGNKDYFYFTAANETSYHIETANIKNGALTSLKVYKGAIGTSNLFASNDQRSSTYNNSSYIFMQANETTLYFIEVSRFNSTTQNYGLDTTGFYNRTAGRYGTYALGVTKATGSADSSKTHHSSLSLVESSATSTNNNVTGEGSTIFTNSGAISSSTSGGGCILHRR